jgi:hypothetical protein
VPDTHSDHQQEVRSHRPAVDGPGVTPSDQPSRSHEQNGIPLRDWILLPLIAVVTIAVLGEGTRFIADREVVRSKQVVGTCIQQTGSGPRHGVPNSVCIEKNSSNKLVEYRFNSCGDRTPLDCGPKPAGVYRIVLIGSSIPMGWGVTETDSLAERLATDLTQSTHRRVEVYNSAMEGSGGSPSTLANRMSQVMALQPDLVLWVMSSWDIDPDKIRVQEKASQGGLSGSQVANRILTKFKIVSYLTELLYRSESVFMSAYVRNIQEGAHLPADSHNDEDARMRLFSVDAGTIVDRAKAADVPVVATFLPNRGESALILMSPRSAQIDPVRLSNALRTVLVSKGAIYVDAVPDLEKAPNLDRFYDPLGFHLTAQGHAVLTQILAKALTGGAVAALSTTEQRQPDQTRLK